MNLIFLFFYIQEEYQKLEMHVFDMEAEISCLQEALTTSVTEKDEALSKVELITSELEDLANKLNSAESERNSLSDEVALLVYITCLCKYPNLIAFLHSFCLLNFSIMKLYFVMQTKRLNASESNLTRLEASLNSVSREKEDMGMVKQYTLIHLAVM